jgi:hypothetical protein
MFLMIFGIMLQSFPFGLRNYIVHRKGKIACEAIRLQAFEIKGAENQAY